MNLHAFTRIAINQVALTTSHVRSAYAVAKNAARGFGAVDIQRQETMTRLVEAFGCTSFKTTFIAYFVCVGAIVTT
jgi:hypothetical protein